MARNRRQRRPLLGGIACCVNRRIADALEEVVEPEAAVLDRNIGDFQVQLIERRSATRRVNDELGLDYDRVPVWPGSAQETSFDSPARRHGCSGPHLHVDSSEPLHPPTTKK